MNKRTFRYLYIVLIFLIILNINFLSASDIDYGTDIISDEILSDGTGVDEVNDGDSPDTPETNDNGENNENPDTPEINDNGESNEEPSNPQINDNGDENDGSSSDGTTETTQTQPKPVVLIKTSLSTSDYVIKNKYLSVTLKDNAKKVVAKKKIKLTINGKTLTATTNSKGIAKFNITNAAKTYKINLKFEGDEKYKSSSKTLNLRVIAKPIYTKLTIVETGIIKNDYLQIHLRTSDKKAIKNQTIKVYINGKTYTRTTDKNGLAKVKLNLSNKIYNLTIKYAGKGNYIPTTKNIKINVLNRKLIGKTSYGKVYFIGVIGNRSSKVKIAYVVGLHSMEHKIHDSVYKTMKNKVNMKYKYYIYKIVLTNKKGSYSTLRMRGQKLAKKYIVPHAKKQKFDLVVDIHSTSGITYKKTYFIHVPKNQHQPSMKLAKKTIKIIKSIEKNSKMQYWSPPTQTSPPYIHLPLIKAGTPTFVFETWSYEKKSQTNKRAKILIQAVDKVFG